MAKKKRFEHRATRPTLAASLEAVRQGKVLAPIAAEPAPRQEAAVKHQQASVTNEAAFVKQEIRRIGLIMGSLLVVLLLLTYLESTASLLTQTAQRFIR